MRKNFYLFLLLIAGQWITAQNVTIPDLNFKNKILASGSGNTIARNLAGNYFAVDANGDGEIQQSEASQVKSLNVNSSGISSLNGITDFVNLETLSCNNNSINKVYLSSMASVKWVDASYNILSNGGISVGPNIEHIDLHNVTFSQDELDLSQKNLLTYLNLQNSNIYALNCSNSKLTTLNLNGCSNLHALDCSNNLLTSLDLSGLNITGEAYYLGPYTFSKGGVNCSHNNLTNLNISNLTTNFLDCSYNNISTLNANSLTLVKMPNVPVSAIFLPSLYFNCSHNQLTSLLTNGSFIIQYFDCSYNNLNTLNITNIETQFFNCNNNMLTTLNISDSSKINILNLSYNLLTSFISPTLPEVTNPDAIKEPMNLSRILNCSNNSLTFLDLNKTQILSQDASNNNISTLFIKNGILNEFIDLQNNPNIQFVCADDIPYDPYDPSNTEVNYFQAMLPGAVVGSNCGNFLQTDAGIKVKKEINVYPNPAKDYVIITAESSLLSVEIYDLQGRLLKKDSGIFSTTARIDLDSMPAGVYLFKIKTEKGNLTKKIIKK